MLVYFIKSALVLSVLYSLYRVTLRCATFHRLSRWVLMVILMASALLPAVPLMHGDGVNIHRPLAKLEQWGEEGAGTLPAGQMVTVRAQSDRKVETSVETVTWSTWANRTYAIATTLLLVGYAVSLLLFVRTLLSSVRVLRIGRIDIRTTPRLRTPVSWMHRILLPAADLGMQPAEGAGGKRGRIIACERTKCLPQALLAHELAHVRAGHSWDRLLCDVLTRLMWFCPFAWMLRSDLISVHEFMADRRVVQGGVGTDDYSRLLLDKAVRPRRRLPEVWTLAPVPQLSDGGLRRRLRMLYAAASRPAVAYRAMLLLPLTAFMWLVVGRPSSLAEAVEARSLEDLGRTLMGNTRPMARRVTTDTRPNTYDAAPTHPADAPSAAGAADTEAGTTTPPTGEPAAKAAPAESVVQLAERLGLPHSEQYRMAVSISGTNGQQDLTYMVDGRRVTRETFEQLATVRDDAATGRTWALAGDGVSELSAMTREAARDNVGVDAPVMHLKTCLDGYTGGGIVVRDIHRELIPNEDRFYMVTQQGKNIVYYNLSLE